MSGPVTAEPRPTTRRFLDSLVEHDRVWAWGILIVAAVLRFAWPGDIEFKLDEEYMFFRTQNALRTEPWPWLGMESGVHVRNPGMSVWIFILLAQLTRANDPISLSMSVMGLNTVAIGLLIWIVRRRFVGSEKEAWLWGLTLAAVNPFAVMYQRKIWAQSVLPIFTAGLLWCWWERRRSWPAFFWGVIGAVIGQIHMSGYFVSAALVLWTWIHERSSARWKPWLVGSLIGVLPMIPWLHYYFTTDHMRPATWGLAQAFELRYWTFWVSDALGLHLGNPLGVTLGNSWMDQLRDFFRYPLVGGSPTWGVAVLHAFAVAVCALLLLPTARRTFTRLILAPRAWLEEHGRGDGSDSARSINSLFWVYGAILTASLVHVRRYYLIITFPIEFVWLAHAQLKTWSGRPGIARALLAALAIVQLLMTTAFLHYIHVNAGASRGDYGEAYWKKAERLQTLR